MITRFTVAGPPGVSIAYAYLEPKVIGMHGQWRRLPTAKIWQSKKNNKLTHYNLSLWDRLFVNKLTHFLP